MYANLLRCEREEWKNGNERMVKHAGCYFVSGNPS